MKFFKLGLIISTLALSGNSAFATPSDSTFNQFIRECAVAIAKAYDQHQRFSRSQNEEPRDNFHTYDASKEYEKLKNEAMLDFKVQHDMHLNNATVDNAFGEIFNRLLNPESQMQSINIDERRLINAPLGVKRWVVYHLMAQFVFYTDPNNNLAASIRETWDKVKTLELETQAGKTACDLLNCEYCCSEFADFIEKPELSPELTAHYPTPQEVRGFAKQHAGKACRDHAKQVATENTVQA